jgi:hypothetical protein
MAKSRSRASSRKPASQSRKSTDQAAEIEVVEEEGGLGIEDGVVLGTTLLLVVAILLIDRNLGVNFGQGMFFK